mmetsp:Transcript_62178/g.196235  ORF Transcript_62178/g.196235 Transcript_62178/m.196235 type:complete len:546 (+) Transcript_62178:1-1638(+)
MKRLQLRLVDAQARHDAAKAKLRAELEAAHELTSVDLSWLQRVEAERVEVIRSQRHLRHAEMRFALASCEEALTSARAHEARDARGPADQSACAKCGQSEQVAALLCALRGHSRDLCSRFQDSVAENVQLIEALDELQAEVAGFAAALKESSALGADPELRAILVSLEEAGRQTVYDRLSGCGRWLSERFAEQRRRCSGETKREMMLCLQQHDPDPSAARAASEAEEGGCARGAAPEAGPDAGVDEAAAGVELQPEDVAQVTDRRPPPGPPAGRRAKRLRPAARASAGAARRVGERAAAVAAAAEAAVEFRTSRPSHASQPCAPPPEAPALGEAPAGAAAGTAAAPPETGPLAAPPETGRQERTVCGPQPPTAPLAAPPGMPEAEGLTTTPGGSRPPTGGTPSEGAGGGAPAPAAPRTMRAAAAHVDVLSRGMRRWRAVASGSAQALPVVQQAAPQQARRRLVLDSSPATDAVATPRPPPQANLAGPSSMTPRRPTDALPAIARGCRGVAIASRRSRVERQGSGASQGQAPVLGGCSAVGAADRV